LGMIIFSIMLKFLEDTILFVIFVGNF